MRVVLVSPVRSAISTETIVNRAAPSATQNPVRIPAGRLRILRSTPMMEPSIAAQASRAMIVPSGRAFSCNSQTMAGFYTLQFELGQFREAPCPGVYLAALEHAQPVQAKPLHGKTSEHRTIDHPPAKRCVAQIFRSCQVTHKTSRKAISG